VIARAQHQAAIVCVYWSSEIKMHGLYFNDASWLDTTGRFLILAFFLIIGIRNLSPQEIEEHVKRLTFFKAPIPRQTLWVGIILEAIGCALILMNWYPAIGTLCLIVFTVAASLLMLRFWEVDDPMRRMCMQNCFFANIAILGGLVLLLKNMM
jgi:putative oxidoreductase